MRQGIPSGQPQRTFGQLRHGVLLGAADALLDALLELAEPLGELAAGPAEIDPLDAVLQLASEALQVGGEVSGEQIAVSLG